MIADTQIFRTRARFWLCAAALAPPWAVAQAHKTVSERLAFDAHGTVEIVNVAGSVELSGWDRPEIEVTGTTGESVERVDVIGGGSHASVRVVPRNGSSWGEGASARLTVHIPKTCGVNATLVSADITVKNLQGEVKLQTVSGDIGGEVGGDLHLTTVSGNVHVNAPAAQLIEAKTISGDMVLSGGAAGAEAEITTISGDVQADLAAVKRARFKSVSGDMLVNLALAAGGHVEGESISGTMRLNFPTPPDGDFDIETLSGDIDNCFGPKPSDSRYGPGSKLTFKNGDGAGHVHIQTRSGDVHLCTREARTHRSAASQLRESERIPVIRTGFLVVALRERLRFRPLL